MRSLFLGSVQIMHEFFEMSSTMIQLSSARSSERARRALCAGRELLGTHNFALFIHRTFFVWPSVKETFGAIFIFGIGSNNARIF